MKKKINILLLSSFTYLFSILISYTFIYKTNHITYATFILPILFLVLNYIIKNNSSKDSLFTIISSLLVLLFLTVLVNFTLGSTIDFISIFKLMGILFLVEFINIILYKFFEKKTNLSYIILFIHYLILFIVFDFIYILFYINTFTFSYFIKNYITLIIIEVILSFIFGLLDKLIIKRKK